LSEVLSARIAFRTIERDGYGENRCAGAPPLGSTVSHCGEAINFGTGNVSPVPPGLERDVNDRSRWAGRGSIRFQPTEYDMDWVFNVHGSQLDEYSRLGQAIGTAGTQTYPDGTQIGGILGGTAGTIQNYRDRDILDMRLNVRNKLLAQGLTRAALRNARDIVVMNELARDLDSDPYAGDYNRTGKTRLDTWGGYLSGEMTIGETTNFRTITAYDAYERYTNTDTDFTPNILFENASTDRTWPVYQDLKLDGEVSGLGGGSFLESLGRVFNDATTYSLGAYTLIERQDSNVNNFLDPQLAAAGAAFRKFDQENESFGAYAEFEWEFLDDFTLKGGFRYNWQRSRMEFELFRGGAERKDVGTQTWDHPTGTLRLTYQMTDEVQVYAKYNHGWKAGYFNATGSLFKGFTPTDPEKIDAYEVGLRGNFFDGQVDFETALFYYRYEDYQVFQVDQDFGSLPEVEVINASDAENYGAEISVTIEPADFLEGLSITARGAWLESQFLDFTDPQLVQLQTSEGLILANISQDYSGNRLINSPQFSFSISGHWTLDFGKYGSLIPRYGGNWTDDVAFDSTGGRGLENDEGQLFLPDNTLGQEAYWIHNARLAYRLAGSNIEIAGWVRNFTDQSAKVGGFNASAFQNVIINFVNEPRTYGMDVQISW
jgi:iron complex outermembrane receptor protein